ncbi:MAG: phenylalanine--tRNA ligase subunit beta, partial [Lysobacteraceae bacterium]
MKFSEQWLRQHVTVDASLDELAATLTRIGLEVEEVTQIGGALRDVVVAQILDCAPHPAADRLQVCRVDAGLALPVQIVCGAPNVRAGLKAPLAMIGAVLPNDIEIKAATLRGIESSGMLCSAKELGIDADASGLLELPDDAPVGSELADLLQLPDASIEIKLTPNRADCFSVRGIAFDVAAACGTQVNPHPIAAIAPSIQTELAIEIDADSACPRYCGRLIEGVDPRAPTPSWMRERLKRSGVRPISLLVDVTSYVMLELGQPMHAYDADKVYAPIRVRPADTGETLTLLDARDVVLDPGFLVIADSSQAIGLAGIMGGLTSRVTDDTTGVFLEAAHFAPSAIIGRARKLGLHTDASQRFERGVDPQLPREAIEYATALIIQHAGGNAGPITETVSLNQLPSVAAIALRRQRLARVLGVQVDDSDVERILSSLGMQVASSADGWHVTPPSRRFDLAIEEDLIEEVARIHGYERIPTTMPSGEIKATPIAEARVAESELRRQFAARDYVEAINYAFVDAALLAQWSLDADVVALANPLSTELGAMRPALTPGLVEAVRRNRARQQDRVRLFEVGRVFHQRTDGAPLEITRIAAVACGSASAEQWSADRRPVDFHDLKGDLDSVIALAGVDSGSLQYQPSELAWLHPGRSASVWRDGALLGWIGHLHPRLLRTLDLEGDVVAMELDVDLLTSRALPLAVELSRYPFVRRDLALIVSESMPWARLHDSVRGA